MCGMCAGFSGRSEFCINSKTYTAYRGKSRIPKSEGRTFACSFNRCSSGRHWRRYCGYRGSSLVFEVEYRATRKAPSRRQHTEERGKAQFQESPFGSELLHDFLALDRREKTEVLSAHCVHETNKGADMSRFILSWKGFLSLT